MMGFETCGVPASWPPNPPCSNAMNTVSFPSYVATIARRIFNVVSTISISSHYDGLQDEKRHLRPHQHLPPDPFGESEMTTGRRSSVYEKLKGLHPPRSGGVLTGEPRLCCYSRCIEDQTASAIPIPLLNRNWWESIFTSSGTENDPPPSHEPSIPPSDHHRKNGHSHGHRSHKQPEPEPTPAPHLPPDPIHQLMMNPALRDPLRTPRYPIVLSHGTQPLWLLLTSY